MGEYQYPITVLLEGIEWGWALGLQTYLAVQAYFFAWRLFGG